MYTGYILRLNEVERSFTLFQRRMYIESANEHYEKKKALLHQRMANYIEKAYDKYTHCVIMKNIEKYFFPNVKSQVFLSHSRKDKDNALALAGYLWQKCKIEVFIDSMLWGYCDALLNQLDECYSQTEPNKYDYDERNITTAQVHVLLNMALAQMINYTECFIFLESENSLKNHSKRISSEETASPWIYSELLLSEIIQKRTPAEHRRQYFSESISHGDSSTMPSFIYNAMLSQLHPLRIDTLKKIASKGERVFTYLDPIKQAECTLDLLYKETERFCDE